MTTETIKLQGQDLIDFTQANLSTDKRGMVIKAGYVDNKGNPEYTEFYEALLYAKGITEEGRLSPFDRDQPTLVELLTLYNIESIEVVSEQGDISLSDITIEYKTEEAQDKYQLLDIANNCLEDELQQYILENRYELFEEYVLNNFDYVEGYGLKFEYYHSQDKVSMSGYITQEKHIDLFID